MLVNQQNAKLLSTQTIDKSLLGKVKLNLLLLFLLAGIWASGSAFADAQSLRGINVCGACDLPHTPDALITLQRWKVNSVRWQIARPEVKIDSNDIEAIRRDLYNWDVWLNTVMIPRLDEHLRNYSKQGIGVIISLHTPPGGTTPNAREHIVFFNQEAEDRLVGAWQRIAGRYKDNPTVWGYDLLNEPAVPGSDYERWNRLAERIARAVRQVDTRHELIVESVRGNPDLLGRLRLLPSSFGKVRYSFHMYAPESFTHQGVRKDDQSGRCPSLNYRSYDNSVRARVTSVLNGVAEWQRRARAKIYVGEFSVTRCLGETGASYLEDVIRFFETKGYDWSYHEFRGFHHWDLERAPANRRTVVVNKFRNNR